MRKQRRVEVHGSRVMGETTRRERTQRGVFPGFDAGAGQAVGQRRGHRGAAGLTQALGVHQCGRQRLEAFAEGVDQGAHGVAVACGAIRSFTQA